MSARFWKMNRRMDDIDPDLALAFSRVWESLDMCEDVLECLIDITHPHLRSTTVGSSRRAKRRYPGSLIRQLKQIPGSTSRRCYRGKR